MIKKTINCPSCEIKCDIIIRESNFDEDEEIINYCPCCSTELDDMMELNYDDE